MKSCEAIQEELVAVLAGEAAPDPETERHLARCAECAAAARELSRTWALLGQDAEIPLPVLARLRITGALARAQDAVTADAPSRHARPSAPRRAALRPIRIASAIGLAAVLVLGVTTAFLSIRHEHGDETALLALIRNGQLRHVDVQMEEGSPIVRLSLSVPRAIELRGRAEDEPIQTVLTELLTGGDARASTRSRACEALRGSGSMSPRVRQAMLHALLGDPNPSVRLKAADALISQVSLPDVQQAFLKVLDADPNPGLRVRAIDAILASPSVADQPDAIDVLRHAATTPDGDRYVQIRAAEFLRGL